MTSFNAIVWRARKVARCRVSATAKTSKSIPIRFGSIRIASIKYAPTSYRFSSTRTGSIKYGLGSFKFSQVFFVARPWHRRLVRYAVLAPSSHSSKVFKESRFKLAVRESDYSLADAFGVNARQDRDYLILKKSDFVQFGLKDNAEWNTREFIAAWLLKGASKFKEDRQIRIQFYRYIHVSRGNKTYEKKSYIINAYCVFGSADKFPSPKEFLG